MSYAICKMAEQDVPVWAHEACVECVGTCNKLAPFENVVVKKLVKLV